MSPLFYAICWIFQVSVLADDILKNVEYDALRIVFNKFHSVVQFLPTVATVLSPEVLPFVKVFENYSHKKTGTQPDSEEFQLLSRHLQSHMNPIPQAFLLIQPLSQ